MSVINLVFVFIVLFYVILFVFVIVLLCCPSSMCFSNRYHAYAQNEGAYFMDLYDGSLCGSGKAGTDVQGGDIITRGDRV